jgi:hypothetical protein
MANDGMVKSAWLSAEEWEQLKMAAKARLQELQSIATDGFDADTPEDDRLWCVKNLTLMKELVNKMENARVLRLVGTSGIKEASAS